MSMLARSSMFASALLLSGSGVGALHRAGAVRLKHCVRSLFPPLHCQGGSDSNDLLDPHCKVALVTEGTTNVGFGVAQELLCQGAETVVITGTHSEAGLEAAGKLCSHHGSDRAVFMQADTSCSREFQDVFKETIRRYGGVDIMFNNPRLLGAAGDWEQDVNVNLTVVPTREALELSPPTAARAAQTNVLRGCVLAMAFMGRDRGYCGGVVVNNAGVEGLQPFAASPAHCAAEHGVVGATRSFQGHSGKTGVRVVGLCCGQTDSDQSKGGGGDTPRQSTRAAAKAVLHMIRRAPAGSIWVLDSGELFAAQIPDRSKISRLVTKYV